MIFNFDSDIYSKQTLIINLFYRMNLEWYKKVTNFER